MATDIRSEEAVTPPHRVMKNSTRHLTSQQTIHCFCSSLAITLHELDKLVKIMVIIVIVGIIVAYRPGIMLRLLSVRRCLESPNPKFS
jgi:hypothetical protein